ncbi:MAG: adenosylcobalamin-dependent ribonucleoside-diphosphate reductase [Bacteroidales bacterium]|nr:adenosylcobalamin-dependent ribonucleoside-diphosphate reductase [Bacteroidales bacterium]MDY5789789.1 adenosylcobalamin-dependent ribonucleoside-diphosphate reductase [Candidatus Onthomorpha sp.]MCI7465500.1 adenosylcobalamin-dependent ribonucleoside-diphosphate reductase [Bacteroidales bacterium]MCI7661572.1 adenosylcobalamin-dependent ribonucleoside-diphosphate reductase [Bacteroidales bacterium]MCI7701174.1 adenosylcobalamin-dependent ribonucleoside-diphosphate reductase [Bacteroidales b
MDRKEQNKEEILKSCIEYFKGDTLAADVWINKYALRDGNKVYELNPDEMHRRLAREFARIEHKYKNPLSEDDIYELLKDFKYIIPQGSPMAGIGNNFQVVSLSNCFVIGNPANSDSYGGILKIDQEQVQLMKRRGGVGHDLSHIRPKMSPVKNSALTSTGIVPFMERYSNTTKEVAQGGRRGALMLSISIKHPDAEDFIDAKMELNKITGANVSVKIDDEFMRCVVSGKPYKQQFPINSDNPSVIKEIDARELWKKIIHNAWQSAEPGVLFWDTIIRESVPDCYASFGFKTISTNPCGEIPLCAYDSCRLLAINLYSYVKHPFTPEAEFDFELFKQHVQKGQKLMDDLIDLEMEKIERILAKIESDPEPEGIKRTEKELWLNIKMKCLEGRRTGFGITAEGDMLAAMGLTYGTDEATAFAVEVQKTLACSAYRSSALMARDRGAFPIYDYKLEENNPFIQRLKSADEELYSLMKQYGRRNIALLTIAPTGSVSICTQTSSGIEPAFLVSYRRRRKVNPNDSEATISFTDDEGQAWEEYNVLHHKFAVWAEINGYNVADLVHKYTDEQLQEVIAKSPYNNATANCVNWVNKVKMQGAIQKWVDHSISVTVNIPKETSEEVVDKIYQTAWESGCKGMTIYRDGSRNGVLVSGSSKNNNTFTETKAPKRPKKLEADIIRFQNDKEKWIAVVGLYEGRPYEIFSGKAASFVLPNSVEKGWVIRVKEEDNLPARYDFQFLDNDGYKVTIEGLSRMFKKEYWNYAKLISGILRHGMPITNVIELISKLTLDTDSINTWKNGIARALKKYVKDGTIVEGEKCPQCGGKIIYTSGCKQCSDCGWSKCG